MLEGLNSVVNDVLYWIKLPAALYAAPVFFLSAFNYVRKSGHLKLFSGLDEPLRRIRNLLLFQNPSLDSGYPSLIPETEREFYDRFAEHLSHAKSAIYNCGDGFNLSSPANPGSEWTSRQKANELDKAIILALDENPQLIYRRFQILGACNINWLSRLIALKRKYGDRFVLYTNRDFDHIGCFCAIDPDSDDCVFEWQLVSGRHGIEGTISKGFGFTFGHKKLCQVVRNLFVDIGSAQRTNFLRTDRASDIMTVARMRELQNELWEERIARAQRDPSYTALDPEIREALRKVDRHQFDVRDLPFEQEIFIAYESLDVEM